MAKPGTAAAAGARARTIEEIKPTAADVAWLMQSCVAGLHTHTTNLPYKGVRSTPIVERKTLLGEIEAGQHVASTTIRGSAFKAVINCSASTVGAAMRLADDLGYGSGGGSFLDLVLASANDLDQRTGIPATTIAALRSKLRATPDTTPAQFSADHAVVYFEAGGQEVLITPVMPVRVLRSINSRLARREVHEKAGKVWVGKPPVRLAMLVPQGGAQPQNVAHYVNAGPKVLADGRIQNTGSRRGGYYALRARTPTGQREAWQRDLSRIIASGILANICRLNREAAQLYSRRSRTLILLPGLSARLAALRAAEVQHAQEIVSEFLAPLFALRRLLQDEKRTLRNLARLSAEDARWLSNAASREDLYAVARRLADELCTRISKLERRGLAAESREAIRAAAVHAFMRSAR